MMNRRIAALLLMLVGGAACFTTQPVGALQPTQDLPRRVSIYRYDGEVIRLDRARIAADTVRGFAAAGFDEFRSPLAHIDSMTYQRLERRDSAIFATVVVVLIVRSTMNATRFIQ
jgi:hypothetical protein